MTDPSSAARGLHDEKSTTVAGAQLSVESTGMIGGSRSAGLRTRVRAASVRRILSR